METDLGASSNNGTTGSIPIRAYGINGQQNDGKTPGMAHPRDNGLTIDILLEQTNG